ncbi:hypothetical protein JCM3765_002442 [Sporobolomyces pararoseus]
MSRNNPLPVSLQQECRKACKIFSSFVDPVNGLDNIIPPSILRKAKGFAFLTIVKAGFVFSARAGTGVVIARLKDGTWSAPSAIGTAGVGAGFQAGAEITEFMIILNSSAAVKSFMTKGSLTVGGNMSVSAGPLGRNLEGTGTLSAKGGASVMYSYSRSKGLFGGASIEGSIIVERSDANSKAYGFNVTAKQLLSGNSTELPSWAEELGQTIKRRSGRDNRIPGWIEDGDEIEREREWDSDEEEEPGREVFRDDGLTPKEYGERGYSFGSQYASGGSHQVEQASSNSSPNRSRSGSNTSKFGGFLSSSRSRSGSGTSSTLNNDNNMINSIGRGGGGGGGGGGPINGDGPNFATKFETFEEPDLSRSRARASSTSTSSPLRSPPLTNKDFSLIDAQDPFSDLSSSSSSQQPISAQTIKNQRPGLFKRMSSSSTTSKLTKINNNPNNGLKERVGQMNWSTFENDNNNSFSQELEKDQQRYRRDSFDSLDDDGGGDIEEMTNKLQRKRATTISSNPSDTLSSYHRPPLSKTTGGRSRSFTSPFGGGTGSSSSSSPFSFKKNNNNNKQQQTSDFHRNPNNNLYPIRSNDSNSSSNSTAEDRNYEFDEPEYRRSKVGGGKKDPSGPPKPWDSEDENFLNSSEKPFRPSPSPSPSSFSKSTTKSIGGQAFDFNQVEADFQSVLDGNGLSSGRRSRSSTITNNNNNQGGRSRSSTLTTNSAQTSTKGAIGTAIAKYDFKGVESTDLPFRKGDVLVILEKEDEEWWKARLKLNQGMIPRNYIGEIEWY